MVLKVGFSKIDITPPIVGDLSIPILGNWWERAKAYNEIHDRLYARVACFQGDDEFVVVSMDAFGDGIGFTDSIRRLASKRIGIPYEKIMVSCTHTHTAPETYGLCWYAVDEKWLDKISEQVAATIKDAHRRLEPATMHVGTMPTEGLVINRRAEYVRKEVSNGEVQLTSEELARTIDLDENLYVFAFLRADRSPIGILANFACHPVIMQTAPMISSDYAGLAAEEAEKLIGAVALYLNGPCGDVNPACGDTGNYDDVVALGTSLTSYVQQVVKNVSSESSVKEPLQLSAGQAVIKVRRRDLPPKEKFLKEKEGYEGEIMARSTAPPPHEDTLRAALFGVREALSLYELPESYEAEVQVFSLGTHAIVGIPGELFTSLGRDIRMAKRETMLIATMANKMLGYIASCEAFTIGGYEMELARWSRLAPGSGEAIRDAVVKLLRS